MEDAQQQHDLEMMGKEIRFEKGSAKKLGAMLKKKRLVLTAHDPVSSIVKNHPNLTEERAAEIMNLMVCYFLKLTIEIFIRAHQALTRVGQVVHRRPRISLQL